MQSNAVHLFGMNGRGNNESYNSQYPRHLVNHRDIPSAALQDTDCRVAPRDEVLQALQHGSNARRARDMQGVMPILPQPHDQTRQAALR